MVKRIAITSALLLLCGCTPNLCANTQITEYVSPDRNLKAVVFRRACGATTKETVQVSILPAKKLLPNKGGNVFVADGTPMVVVRWLTAGRLSIRVSGGTSGAF